MYEAHYEPTDQDLKDYRESLLSYEDGYSDANSDRNKRSSNPDYLRGYEDGFRDTFESEY